MPFETAAGGNVVVCRRTTAVTGPPPKNYDFKTRVIGGSRSPLGYLALVSNGGNAGVKHVLFGTCQTPACTSASVAIVDHPLCLCNVSGIVVSIAFFAMNAGEAIVNVITHCICKCCRNGFGAVVVSISDLRKCFKILQRALDSGTSRSFYVPAQRCTFRRPYRTQRFGCGICVSRGPNRTRTPPVKYRTMDHGVSVPVGGVL